MDSYIPSKFRVYSFVSSGDILGTKNDSFYINIYIRKYVKKYEFEIMVFLDSGESETKNVTTPAPT